MDYFIKKKLPETRIPVNRLQAFYNNVVEWGASQFDGTNGGTDENIANRTILSQFLSDLPSEDTDNTRDIVNKKFPMAFIFKLKHEGFIDFYMSN